MQRINNDATSPTEIDTWQHLEIQRSGNCRSNKVVSPNSAINANGVNTTTISENSNVSGKRHLNQDRERRGVWTTNEDVRRRNFLWVGFPRVI